MLFSIRTRVAKIKANKYCVVGFYLPWFDAFPSTTHYFPEDATSGDGPKINVVLESRKATGVGSRDPGDKS